METRFREHYDDTFMKPTEERPKAINKKFRNNKEDDLRFGLEE